MTPIEQLQDVMRQLRDPETGCEWDIKQTFSTIAPYTLEEAYEVVDAIERNHLTDLQDELGDLLLQVIFHSQMAREQNLFDFADVAYGIVQKLIRRHPHVFDKDSYQSGSGSEPRGTSDALNVAWEAEKERERQTKNKLQSGDDSVSALADVALALPALIRAEKIQKRAARVGFDWPDAEPVWDKIQEEVQEVRDAVDSGDNVAIEDEVGDLLFTVVNLARHLRVDSEQALRRSTAKFETRFKQVEVLAFKDNRDLNELDLDELDVLWEQAKAQSKP